MSTQGGSGLQLPTNEQTRSVILSYLIHHGHKDTARAFMNEVARREIAESIEKCPLWLGDQHRSGPHNSVKIADDVASLTPNHTLHGTNKQITAMDIETPKDPSQLTDLCVRGVSEDILEDAVIRNAITAGKVGHAIDLITRHLPEFLPISTLNASPPSPDPNSRLGSHDPSHDGTNSATLGLPASPSSKVTTPIESTPEPLQLTEKATHKTDAPAAQAPQSGLPKQIDSQDMPVLDRASQRSNNSSLGRSVNPAHILLNLRVQEFIEAVRTIPLAPDAQDPSYIPTQPAGSVGDDELGEDVNMNSPGSPMDGDQPDDLHKSSSTTTDLITRSTIHSVARQRHLFELASKLYQCAQNLQCPRDREIYAKEVEQVCSLMIGPSPENSLAAPYLSMARREALADQVNSSMLHYVGESPAPALQIWAQTTRVVWDQIILSHLPLPRGADIPAEVKMYAHYVARGVEGEDERSQTVMAIPFDFTALARA